MDKLTRRALEGLAQMLVAMAALLFLPAWTLAWGEAWLFLAVFGAAVLAITLYFLRHDRALIERRLAVGPAAEKHKAQKRIQAVASVFFVAVFVVAALDHRFAWSDPGFVWVGVGEFLVLAGLFVVFLVFRENSFTSAVVEVGEGQALVSTGPYGVVRHPMYAGTGIMLVGVALALGALWALAPAALLMASMVVRLVDEEKLLVAELDAYAQYRQKVRYRLVPGVW